METPETLINVAWIGGEMCMREKVMECIREKFSRELNYRLWGNDKDVEYTINFIIHLVEAIELTKVEK